jgi:hypothetical protein
MNQLELTISLFPLVFMIHEFEEIICFKSWVTKNGLWLTDKYPKFAKQIAHIGQLSVPAFSIAVLEEFILVSITIVLALTLQWYSVWIAVFTAFTFHILLHIVQWIVVRKYIPVIITSLLSLPYLIWGLSRILNEFSLSMIMICFVSGTLVAILNLYFVHKFASLYDRTIKNS